MLNVQASMARHPHHEGGALAASRRAGHFYGNAILGQLGADNVRPVLKQMEFVEAIFFERGPGDGRHHPVKTLGAVRLSKSACLVSTLGHIPSYRPETDLSNGNSRQPRPAEAFEETLALTVRNDRKANRPQDSLLSDALLDWYDTHRRDLPWRYDPGQVADPYRVWLSEIMLQQTTVATVIPYFEKFTSKWPSVRALAEAPLDDVLLAWAGLGYYARARNLHKCAKAVADQFGGSFPPDAAALKTLPGIGPYTAAAIASIAFGQKATPVDGNIERVMARLHMVTTPLPDAKPELVQFAEYHTPESRCGDYAQALMDLGATICTPRNPDCVICPCAHLCTAFEDGAPEAVPKKKPKPEKPIRRGAIYWLEWPKGQVLIRQRPEKGLLGGMWEIPSSDWTADRKRAPTVRDAIDSDAPTGLEWTRLPKTVRHTFTHFHLELEVFVGIGRGRGKPKGQWVRTTELDGYALPTVMNKVVRLVQADAGPLFTRHDGG